MTFARASLAGLFAAGARLAAACPSCGGGVAASGPPASEPWGLVGLFLLVPLLVGGIAAALLAPGRTPGANPPPPAP